MDKEGAAQVEIVAPQSIGCLIKLTRIVDVTPDDAGWAPNWERMRKKDIAITEFWDDVGYCLVQGSYYHIKKLVVNNGELNEVSFEVIFEYSLCTLRDDHEILMQEIADSFLRSTEMRRGWDTAELVTDVGPGYLTVMMFQKPEEA